MYSDAKNRPLSPHLQVYRPQMTSILSILHRATGVANAIGLLLFAWWMIAAASGTEAYEFFASFMTSPFGLVLLFGWTASVCYHMCNGIRHLIWDTGHLLDIKKAYAAGYTVLIVAALLTLAIWVM